MTAAALTERLIQAAVDYENGVDGSRRKLSEARAAVEAALIASAQAAMVPAAWQYRVMFDARHERRDEWCPWHDAGEKYFNKVNAEIAAGATRVQTRILYALPSTVLSPIEKTEGGQS